MRARFLLKIRLVQNRGKEIQAYKWVHFHSFPRKFISDKRAQKPHLPQYTFEKSSFEAMLLLK